MPNTVIGSYDLESNGWLVSEITHTPPAPRTNYVTIPGRDGALNLSRLVSGMMAYGQEKHSIKTTYIADSRANAYAAYKGLVAAVHGQKVSVTTPDDSLTNQEVSVGAPVLFGHTVTTTIECTGDPSYV